MALSVALALLVQGTPIVNDDRDVIQTAMLSFFTHEEWHSSDWQPKKHVVLYPKFFRKEREDFRSCLKELLTSCQEELNEGGKAMRDETSDERKHAIQHYIAVAEKAVISLEKVDRDAWTGATYVPPTVIAPSAMQWDKRIKVTEKTNRILRTLRNESEHSGLERWTVYGYPSLPAYSPNGRFAIVKLSVPWSIHSADVIFLFERVNKEWKRVCVIPRFYV